MPQTRAHKLALHQIFQQLEMRAAIEALNLSEDERKDVAAIAEHNAEAIAALGKLTDGSGIANGFSGLTPNAIGAAATGASVATLGAAAAAGLMPFPLGIITGASVLAAKHLLGKGDSKKTPPEMATPAPKATTNFDTKMRVYQALANVSDALKLTGLNVEGEDIARILHAIADELEQHNITLGDARNALR